MDAFYASVELLRYPELRGQPVVIGGGRRHQPRAAARRHAPLRHAARLHRPRRDHHHHLRGARARRAFSAMGMMKAAALAPDAVLLPVDFDEYRKYSRLFKAAVRAIAPLVEDRGIDEIYIDLTELPGAQRRRAAAPSARALKQAVFDATGLTCSIGITPNKLLSKICSELDKPDGLTLLRPRPTSRRASGRWRRARSTASARRRASKLAALGIAHHRRHRRGRPGVPGRALRRAATAPGCTRPRTGATSAPVVTYSEPKSISRETTFERDLHAVRDRAALSAHLHRAVRRSSPATWRARATRARPSASSCASTTSRSSRATSRCRRTRWTRAPSAAPPASA